MRVLIACECSGEVRRAFRALGHDAWSCDLRPAEDNDPHHIQGDILGVLMRAAYAMGTKNFDAPLQWDLLIGHPPCTHLSLSGARWATDHWVKRKHLPPRWHDGSAKRRQRFFARSGRLPSTASALKIR